MTQSVGSRDPGVSTEDRPDSDSHDLRQVLLWWLGLSVVALAGWLVVGSLLLPRAATTVDVFANVSVLVFTALAIPVSLFVWVFVGYSLLHFKAKGGPTAGHPPTEAAPAIVATPGQTIAWLAITGALCIFLVIWGLFGMYREAQSPSTRPLIVDATGQQWAWTFHYPNPAPNVQSVSSNELVLPVNQPVQFDVTSLDVLHGFEIRAFGITLDANPGSVIPTNVVVPQKIGNYTVRCIELCGLYHSYMWAPVRVVSESAYRAWLQTAAGRSTNGGSLT
ncbi:MAG: cytochrome c oxidase subunit II [Actinomycetota bacterium]|nr:cytochrome c oxidase subunit II [Actinomycetota bacterium]